MQATWMTSLFNIDALAVMMTLLVAFIGLTVAVYARRYLQGDAAAGRFNRLFAATLASVIVMVAADNLWLLLAAWGAANLLLVNMMIHKRGWSEARAAGRLAGGYFALGFALIAGAFAQLAAIGGSASISTLLTSVDASPQVSFALLMLLAGAMIQSGIWPFHRWLTSSLNSPTPVSAIMHAGLVNGGGILLARFAPLYFEASGLLSLIFVIGLATALVGTLWKLMQSDVKRMLACSTMGQMGFMFVQCGLGLFPAAVAHLCWHGMFKANLFLASGGAAQERRLDLDYPPPLAAMTVALVCGVLGGACFALVSGKSLLAADTTAVLVFVAALACAQFALPLVRQAPLARLPLAALVTVAAGAFYGLSVTAVESFLAPLDIMRPQPLSWLHIAGAALLTLAWLALMAINSPAARMRKPWLIRAYVRALNASQPHRATVTAHRNHYSHRQGVRI